MPQQIAANSASDFDEVGDFAAVSELRTWNEFFDNAGHKHEGPRLAVCLAAEDDAAVVCLRLKQAPFAFFKIGIVEAIYSDNGRA